MVRLDVGQPQIGADALRIDSLGLQPADDHVAADTIRGQLVGFGIR